MSPPLLDFGGTRRSLRRRRGMRIRVSDVLDILASGLSKEEILDEHPDLEPDDIKACIQYASKKVSHSILSS